jgi:hypothetical protein
MISLANDGSRRRLVKFAFGGFLVLAVFLINRWLSTPEIKPEPFLLTQENWPVTVEEAVRDILPRITPYTKLEMMFTNKDHLGSMHFSLGLSIRNRYGLWRGNEKLILSAGGFRCVPDDASGKILEAVWQELHK